MMSQNKQPASYTRTGSTTYTSHDAIRYTYSTTTNYKKHTIDTYSGFTDR